VQESRIEFYWKFHPSKAGKWVRLKRKYNKPITAKSGKK